MDDFNRVIVGTAEVDVTPPVGTMLAGYGYERQSEGIILPLKASIIVMNEGEKRCVMISCDFISMPAKEVNNIRRHIQNLTGIAPERVMICCTHNHLGPELRETEEWTYTGSDDEYVDRIELQIAQAVVQAVKNQIRGRNAGYCGRRDGGCRIRRTPFSWDWSIRCRRPRRR